MIKSKWKIKVINASIVRLNILVIANLNLVVKIELLKILLLWSKTKEKE